MGYRTQIPWLYPEEQRRLAEALLKKALEATPPSNEMSFPNPLEFSQADLAEFTNNFHGGNLIGPTQFGKLYRGKINARDVTVKIWDGGQYGEQCGEHYGLDYPGAYSIMLAEEMLLLRDSNVNHHPSLPKLIGYCIQDQMKGLVYDLNPRGSLHNLTTEGSFTWIERIKVVLRFAHLLELLHGQANPYIVLCIDAEHILLDQESNPVVVEFGLMRGGNLGQLSPFKELIPMSPGYCDIHYARTGVGWVAHCDVFSYGIILLGLISKRVIDKEKLGTNRLFRTDVWARKNYKPGCSLVDTSLEVDSDFCVSDGAAMTKLGISCVEEYPGDRPTMKTVVKSLESLLAVQCSRVEYLSFLDSFKAKATISVGCQ